MIKFTREKVLLLHQIISEATGGDPNLRDVGLLDSALESAFQTFDGIELYPTKQEKWTTTVCWSGFTPSKSNPRDIFRHRFFFRTPHAPPIYQPQIGHLT